MNYTDTRYDSGFSAIAAVIIAAVVIGGGAVLISNNDSSSENNATSTTEANMEGESTTFSCEDGGEITADFGVDGDATVTLPSGEVKAVSRTEAASGARYATADGSFVFQNSGQEVTVEQDGEVVFDGCVAADDAEGEAEMETGTNSANEADAAAEATSSTDVDAGASVEVDVQGGAEMQ